MWRVPDLSRRVREPELMDDPSLDRDEHQRALAGLARLNRVGRSVPILWDAIRPLATTPGHGAVSILDIATGSGDIPLGLIRRARRIGSTLDIHACDISEYALAEAQRKAEQAGTSITTFRLDAATQQIPGDYDIVMCSLFTHHLDDEQVVDLLYRMKAAARKLVLVNDLIRGRSAYTMAVAASRALSRSRVVHEDAAKSMCAAFTIGEMAALAEQAGLKGADVSARWPCRFLLTWSRER
jgi:2-polyprenyl-3-methyl-5-hydroxy-6-metoxy-1,4-benzoquinol methylase